MEPEAVLVIAAGTSSIPIALWTFSPPVPQMELTMSGIVNGIEQTADPELVHDAKALDLVDIAGAPRDHAVRSGMRKETELVSVEPGPWTMPEEASIAIVVAEVELEVEIAEIFDTASETCEEEMERKGETDVICWLNLGMNLNGAVEELEQELVVAAAVGLDKEVLVVT